MALFQTSVLKTFLTQLDKSAVERAYKKYTTYFHNATIQENIKNSKEEQYQAKFLYENDLIKSFQQKQLKSNIYYFLNFNYTSTLTNILKHLKSEYYTEYGYDINIINSQIQRSLNSEGLIFGFGDEMDKDYKEIEELKNNRFFDNIKSFKYAKYHDCRNLLRFLNSDDYQVVIYGHSCGLSDRLLLNEVFEHENCKSIKIYYYNKEEFIQKTMDISRHFNNNQLMRQKIVEFTEQNQIPQIKPNCPNRTGNRPNGV